MAIFRIKREDNYVSFDKQFLLDPKLSAKAKGVLAYLLTLPPDWDVHVNEISEHFIDGKKSIYSAFQELIAHHYIILKRNRKSDGEFIKSEYLVFNISQDPEGDELTFENSRSMLDLLSTQKIEISLPPSQETDAGINEFPNNPHHLCPHTSKGDVGKGDAVNRRVENRQLQINNKTNNKYNNKTAAEGFTKKLEISPDTNSEIAAAQFKKNDFAISAELTPNQALLINCFVEGYYEKLLKPVASKEVWLVAIKTEILNSNSFTKTEGNFDHKFNAIKSLIKKNKWQPHVVKAAETPPTEQDHRIKSLQKQIRGFELEKNGAVLDLKNWELDSAMAQCRLRSIAACDEALKPLLAELSAVQQTVTPEAIDMPSARLHVQ